MKSIRVLSSAVCLTLVYLCLRLLFLWNNPSTLGLVDTDSLQEAVQKVFALFQAGLWFDLCGAALLNVPFALAVLGAGWVDPPKWLRVSVFRTYLAVNGVMFGANLVDTFYFPFVGKRSTLSVLELGGDLADQWVQLLAQYWSVPFLLVFLVGFFVALERGSSRVLRRLANAEPISPLPRILVRSALTVLIAGLYFVAARGSLGRKPLGVASAYAQVSSLQAPAALNSTFTILKGLADEPLPQPHFLEPERAAELVRAREGRLREPGEGFGMLRGHNVVIVILESFAREYMGNGLERPCYMPFVCELAQSAVYFDWAFANGRRSIDSFYSIHAGIPALQEQALVTSAYGANRLPGLPKRLSEEGYTTAFFHGGRNGTMFFDLMARAVGFQHYYGLNEFDGSQDESDGTWGAFDEPFFRYARKTISGLQEPFLASIFSLTSHNPYRIPESAKGRFPKGTLPIHESIGYADASLRSFFADARNEKWFDKTLFVITADHTSLSDDPEYSEDPGTFRVPLLFLDGSGLMRPQRIEWPVAAQHADMMPTVLHLLGLQDGAASRFGEAVMPEARIHPIINRTGGGYWFLAGQKYGEVVGQSVQVRTLSNPGAAQNTAQGFSEVQAVGSLERELQEPLSMIQVFFRDLALNRVDQPLCGESCNR